MPAGFTQQNLATLEALVARRSSGQLNHHDREDLVGDLLLEGVKANRSAGIPMAQAVFTAAKRTSYYERAAQAAHRMQESLTLDGGDGEGGDNELPGPRFEEVVESAILVSELTEVERTAVLMELADARLVDIAAQLGVSIATAQRVVTTAQQKMRKSVHLVVAA